MGRKPKYANLKTYQPYIDIMLRDLNLADKVVLNISFIAIRSLNGDSILYNTTNNENKRYGEVRISKFLNHADALFTIAHELRHIQQYQTNRLSDFDLNIAIWDGVGYRVGNSRKKSEHQVYEDSPWEVDARLYELEVLRLFPKDVRWYPYQRPKVVTQRVILGKVGGVTLVRERIVAV